MKPEILSNITDGEYYVEKNRTYSRDKKKLCNFWINELCINHCTGKKHELEVSFTITLKNVKKETRTATFSIMYLYEPYGWLHMGFDRDEFSTEMKKHEFDIHFNKILRAIQKHKLSREEYTIGWEITQQLNEKNFSAPVYYYFHKHDDPDKFVDEDDKNNSKTFDEYIKFTNKNISIPLICYTLLAVVNSLLAKNIKQVPDFIFSITGADEQTRTDLALFYTNLYKRNFRFNKRDYRYTHIMPDDNISDVYFKTMLYKDSVLTAFQPSKKRMNQIYENFNNNNFDSDKPIYSLCLFTAKNKTDIPFKTFNIELPHGMNFRKIIEKNFKKKDGYGFDYYEDDLLMDCIYAYIYKLIQKVMGRKINVKHEFIELQSDLQANSLHEKLPDIAAVTVEYLCFAYKLYAKIMNPEISYDEVESIIFDMAFTAFPQKDVITNSDYDKAMEICNVIDNYFSNNKKAMNAIGTETSGNTKLWYDKQYYYITKKDIDEILTLQNCSINFSPKIRKALSDKGILITRQRLNKVSKKITIEYALHITKPLYGEYRSKERYYTFFREECNINKIFQLIGNYFIRKTMERVRENQEKNKV